jgi:hypothetical protein
LALRAFGKVAEPRGLPLKLDKRGSYHSRLLRAEGAALCQPRRLGKVGTPANASRASICSTLG